jgi:hypothetical protein
LTFLMKMTEKTFPEEIIKIVQENSISDKLDVKTLTDAYTLYKEEKIDLAEFEKIAKKQIDLAVDMHFGRTQKRISTEFAGTLKIGITTLFKAVKKIRTTARQMDFFLSPGEHEGIVNDIDKAINELNELRKALIDGEGFFKSGEDEITGKLKLVPR